VLAGSIGALAFLYGMVQYIFGLRQGNGEQTKKGNTFMVWGLVALFVMFSYVGIIWLAQSFFGIQGMNDPVRLFTGGLQSSVSAPSPLSSPGSIFGAPMQSGGSSGVGWTTGGSSGGGIGTVTIGGGGSTGGTVGISGQRAQTSDFMINGRPASQQPGVLSCRGKSSGAWCGLGMECAQATDGSMACFRSMDIQGGRADPNATASVPPTSPSRASPNYVVDSECGGGLSCLNNVCSYSAPANSGPQEPVSAQSGYMCNPGYDCTLPDGGQGICSFSGDSCNSAVITDTPQ
jgi:hypothetical protein